MDSNTTEQYNLDNFVKESGSRFRMTKPQTARVSLTGISVEDRQRVAGMNTEEAADFFNARASSGKPLGWVEKAVSLAGNWSDEMTLTRDIAFQEFLSNGGPSRLQERKPEVPVSVWLDPELTLENFDQKTLEATGHKIRFRIRKEQTARGLSRAAALAEVITQTRESVNQNSEN
jgi:hypothetical protein